MTRGIKAQVSSLSHNLICIPGFRTKQKIVVFESDDWGSIRMPSKKVFERFKTKGLDLAESTYNRLDTLESNEDLQALFGVLEKYKDSHGNPAVFTANTVVGNPDFERIKSSGFSSYFYESVIETLSRYPNRDGVPELWKQGQSSSIYHPQFHGREHVNFIRWMNALREKTPEILFTFDNGTTFSGNGDYNFMEVFDYNTKDDLPQMNSSLIEGLDLFESIFSFRSKSFISPCYTWSSDIESTLCQNGVKYIQGIIVQKVPTGSFGNYKKKYNFLGRRNKHGQIYLTRNAFFEPAIFHSEDSVGACLKRMEIAFKWNKPAIVSSHRINYMGSLVENNRSKNLKLLDQLLGRILKTWPDVTFLTSDQLGQYIQG